MLTPRKPTIFTAVLLLVGWITSPIWSIEVENYWLGNARPFVVAHWWPWTVAMLDTIYSFWGGVLVTLFVLVVFDVGFAWHRRRAIKRGAPQGKANKKQAESSAWALGVEHISIQDAACAFAGIHPESFENCPKARTIYTEIAYDLKEGWLPLSKDLEPDHPRAVLVWSGKDKRRDRVSKTDIVPVYYLAQRYDERGWDTSWIKG